MKSYVRVVIFVVAAACMLVGCASKTNKSKVKNTIEGGFKTYYEMSDDTWMCDDREYKYRLVISGRMPNAEKDSTFVYLSNIKEISFERAFMAAGFSSNTDDYFEPEEAVLVGFDKP